MFRNAVNRLLVPTARNAIVPSRACSVISGPSTVRISKFEKYFLATIWLSAISFVPTWVLVNIKHYKGPRE